MAEVVVKELDDQGRVSIPQRRRKGSKSRKLAMIRREKGTELIPIEATPPSELFDSIRISGTVDFTDPHSLKKVLLETRER